MRNPGKEAGLELNPSNDTGQDGLFDVREKAFRVQDVAKSIIGFQSHMNNDYFGPPIMRLTSKGADEDLVFGAMRGELKRVRRALSCGASLTQTNARGLTPLMLAATSSSGEVIEAASELLNGRSDVRARDLNGWTCLHHAVRNGKTEMAKQLMKFNAEPTWLTGDGRTVLMLATLDGKVDLVKMLLNFRSHPMSMIGEKDLSGNTALHLASK